MSSCLNKSVFALSSLALLLSGCGGGSGSVATVTTPSATLTGTAATGLPIVGSVVAIDSSLPAKIFTATTNAAGAYTVNVAGGTAPFILTVTGTTPAGQSASLSSIATAPGQTVNITPLTDLIVSNASGQAGGVALVGLCTPAAGTTTVPTGCTAALKAATTGANLSSAMAAVTNMMAPVATGINPITDPFVGGSHTGMDAILDKIVVTPASAQNAMMATVTLVNVPPASASLGSVAVVPGTVAPAVLPATPPSAALIAQASTGATALTEINSCMAGLTALYPATMKTAPTAAQVTPFIDATFNMGGPGATLNQAAFITKMSTLASAGTGGFAIPGSSVTSKILGLSPFDPSRQANAAAVVTSAAPVSATTAWVVMDVSSLGGGLIDMKMVKGAAYAGCPSGWRLAGSDHINLHMNARVAKNSFGGGTTYTRYLPFHISTAMAVAEGIDTLVFDHPSLRVYSGNAASPVGAATPVTMVVPATPPAGVQLSWLGIKGQMNVANTNLFTSFYGNAEAIQSCQDLALIAAPAALPPAGTPCYDETKLAPGAVVTVTAHGPAVAPAVTGPVLYAFPFAVRAVPLSRAFVAANDLDLFAQNITATTTISTLQSAIAGFATGAAIDGVIKYNYTVSPVYGAVVDHCGVGLSDVNGAMILNAEQSAVGQPTSCTFTTAGLNFGSLAKPAVPFSTTIGHWKYVGVKALGNQLASSVPY